MTIAQLYTIIGVLFTLLVSVLGFLAKLVIELKISVTELKTLEPERKAADAKRHELIDKNFSELIKTIQNHEIRLVKLEGKD
jgi:hypothetical protein